MARSISWVKTVNGSWVAYRAISNKNLCSIDKNSLGNEAGTQEKPFLFFFSGFNSSMWGRKGEFLERWSSEGEGNTTVSGFVRFDYSTMGESLERNQTNDGGCISQWVKDAEAVIGAVSEMFQQETLPFVFVGSSMGFWIASILAKRMMNTQNNRLLHGMIGIGSAPDFTEDIFSTRCGKEQREELNQQGFITVPSAYDENGYEISLKLIEDGRHNLILRCPLVFEFPVRLLHGSQDIVVPPQRLLKLVEHVQCEDFHLKIIKGKDHRFSDPESLKIIAQTIQEIASRSK